MPLLRGLYGLRFVQCHGPNFYSRTTTSSLPQLVFKSRTSSTVAQTAKPKLTQWRPSLTVGLGFICSGILGYSLATLNKPSAIRDPGLDDQTPQYGSAEDFGKAIAELQDVFSDDIVSTNPDVLYSHGFSVNDYHPGIQFT